MVTCWIEGKRPVRRENLPPASPFAFFARSNGRLDAGLCKGCHHQLRGMSLHDLELFRSESTSRRIAPRKLHQWDEADESPPQNITKQQTSLVPGRHRWLVVVNMMATRHIYQGGHSLMPRTLCRRSSLANTCLA